VDYEAVLTEQDSSELAAGHEGSSHWTLREMGNAALHLATWQK